MITRLIILFVFFALLTFAQKKAVLSNYGNPAFSLELHSELDEISGLALTDDGRLFCNQDETGVVYELNPQSGDVIKKFFIGSWMLERDFEGIAIVDDYFFLVTSDGILYKFKEGKHREKVDYELIKLGFTSKFDIEGLCFDEETNSLLLACKNYPGKKYKGKRAVYSFDLKSNQVNPVPRFLIDIKQLEREYKFKEFAPSAIECSPKGDSFVILSSRGQKGIVEISKFGEIVTAFKFKKKKHRQPEGITFLNNEDIVISDEAAGKKATITFYPIEN